jgi:lipid-A-disaccharide synthase
MPSPGIFFLTGEPSADLHVSLLATELLRRGDYRLTGTGGALMRQAGVQTDFDSTNWGTMGIVQALKRLPEAVVVRGRLLRLLRQRRPDLIVMVDFGGFNMHIGRHVRRFPWHVPILYYFPPKSWDKSEWDRSRLGHVADVVATPFSWSETLLRKDGIDAHWVGHPVVDRVQPVADQQALRRGLGLPAAERYVGFLPGSRRPERALIGPHMIGAALRQLADGGYHFLWSPGPAGTVDRVPIPPQLRPHLTVVERSVDLLQAADLTITSFGTTTLEATAGETPIIGMYRGTALETLAFLMMRLPTKLYAMPNIILGYEAVPELVLRQSDAERLANCARRLFADPEALTKMKQELRRARQELGPPGAIGRTADLVEATLARVEARG